MGLEETEKETLEVLVSAFMQQLGIPAEEVKKIQLERVHRLGQRKKQSKPRPVVV